MPFESVSTVNFRNLSNQTLGTSAEQIFFVGENGQGKTNFLEAIYLLCYGSSFRTKQQEDLITRNETGATVLGKYRDSRLADMTPVKIGLGEAKGMAIGDKTIYDRRQLMDVVPCIVFCHEDIGFVQGGPEEQRTFINQTASLVFPGYVEALRNYTKALKSRNLLLKQEQYELLAVYDQQLVQYGLLMMDQRRQIVDLFNAEFTPRYEAVSGGLSGLSVEYQPSWTMSSPEFALAKLAEKRFLDQRLAMTTTGPHRDKFMFCKNGVAFLPVASTGQIRLISLLLRLCQAVLVAGLVRRAPILLVDDVLLELDPVKRERFVQGLPAYDQAFFTFLPDAAIDAIRRSSSLVFQVEGGQYREKSS